MILTIFTLFHVLLSLVGIGSGYPVVRGFLNSRESSWTSIFLWTTVATSATGFLFPVHQFLPSHGVGILSLIILGFVIAARSKFRLEGIWARVYVAGSVAALYFNVFVLVVQLFQKVPVLRDLAPTQSESPFVIAQLAVLLLFAAVGTRSTLQFRAPTLGRA